ncbi:MAG: extracellular solute-binding protein [Clostridia bacterium]|nr:extracellular solute-binding protein [Clostridia bacterium]
MNIEMRMRKIISLVLLLGMALFVLSGCHGTMDRDAADQNQISKVPLYLDETKKIELNFWAKNDTNKVQTAVYTDAIEEFQKLYPNITVNIRLYADYGRIFNDVITNIATNTTPNVCITYPDHIATYLTGDGVMLPLEDWMTDPRFGLGGSEVRFDSPKKEEIAPKFLEECVIRDGYYALPYMRSTEALYINKELVEKLGYQVPDVLTWDFVWEVSEKAMEKNEDGTFKVNGQNVMIPFIYKSTDNMMITMLRQLGAPYSNENGEVLIFNDTTAKLLKEIYTHAKSRAFSTFAISSYPGNFLNAGQCIFALDSTAGATWMGSSAPMLDIHKEQVVPFTTLVRPVPQFDTENPVMISQGPSICVFNKSDPQEVLASWLFAQYMLTNKVQLSYAETEGYLPVTLKAQQSEEYQDYLRRKGEDNQEHYDIKIEASELLLKYLDNTFVTPVFNGSASLRSAAGQLIENVCKSARRKEEMNDDYIEKQYHDVSSLYRLDQIRVTASGTGETGGETEEVKDKPFTWNDLPGISQALLISLPCIWILIIGISLFRSKKRSKNN